MQNLKGLNICVKLKKRNGRASKKIISVVCFISQTPSVPMKKHLSNQCNASMFSLSKVKLAVCTSVNAKYVCKWEYQSKLHQEMQEPSFLLLQLDPSLS